MANREQENRDRQERRNNDAEGTQTGGQSDYRRSEQRNDNPESFDDDYEAGREDEMVEDEAETEDEDQH